MKKLDKYILKQFIGPFVVLFSIIQFVLVINFLYQKIEEFSNKGLDAATFGELFSYGAISLVPLGLPIAMLLASIMAFGSLGEKYELAAIKSTGTSIWRTMRPLFILSILIAIFSYWFSENISTKAQVRFRNLIINIITSKSTLELDPGVFISNIPGNSMKIGSKYIDSAGLENFEDILIYQASNTTKDRTTIKAKYGKVLPKDHPHYLKIQLLDGSFYKEVKDAKSRKDRKRQEFQRMKFDTLDLNIDVKSLVAKDFNKNNVSQHRQMLTNSELKGMIDTLQQQTGNYLERSSLEHYHNFVRNYKQIDTLELCYDNLDPKRMFDSISPKKKIIAIENILTKVEVKYKNFEGKEKIFNERFKNVIKYQITHSQRITLAFLIVLLCLIGAPLGAVIRKGGLGLPMVTGVIVFVVYHSLNIMFESIVKRESIVPDIGIWLPSIIMLPIVFWVVYKTNKDQPIVTINKSKFKFKKRNLGIRNYFTQLLGGEISEPEKGLEKQQNKVSFWKALLGEEPEEGTEKTTLKAKKSFWQKLLGEED